MNIRITPAADARLLLSWDACPGAASYRLRWSDRETTPGNYKALPASPDTTLRFPRIANRPYRFYAEALDAAGTVIATGAEAVAPVTTTPSPSWKPSTAALSP